MTISCPACKHSNAKHRGYCGACGATLQPVCRGCRFLNEARDKFCGGCGGPMLAMRAVGAAPAPPAAAFRAPREEVNDLFAPVAVAADEALPAGGITQSDLDRLFGVQA